MARAATLAFGFEAEAGEALVAGRLTTSHPVKERLKGAHHALAGHLKRLGQRGGMDVAQAVADGFGRLVHAGAVVGGQARLVPQAGHLDEGVGHLAVGPERALQGCAFRGVRIQLEGDFAGGYGPPYRQSGLAPKTQRTWRPDQFAAPLHPATEAGRRCLVAAPAADPFSGGHCARIHGSAFPWRNLTGWVLHLIIDSAFKMAQPFHSKFRRADCLLALCCFICASFLNFTSSMFNQ